MKPELARLFESSRVPRYTSYPTAPHFSAEVDAGTYETWLRSLEPGTDISLYLHVPYCRKLCWYCGCSTQITGNKGRLDAYADLLERELDLLAARLPRPLALSHLHWGGGTPSIIGAARIEPIMARIADIFAMDGEAERAIELDPRMVEPGLIEALARSGINRASLGVQTFDPTVQEAINRVQDLQCVRSVVDRLRARGIERISMDLLYGLPHQTVANLVATVDDVLRLRPDRIALFGLCPSAGAHQASADDR